MAVQHAEVIVAHHAFIHLVAGMDVHCQLGVLCVEAQQPREQPVLCHRMGADHADIAAAVPALEAQYVGQQAVEHRLDDGIEATAGGGQGDAAGAAFEQRRTQVFFKQLD
uniref:Uncharacterized protein n=1 Tax=Steinernema glaseri TaxID=37863 RepID=A0A1I8AV05_9BILA